VAVKGYDVMLRELLARGAEPDARDKEGRTALHLAAGGGHLQVVQDLLRRRADTTIRDKVSALGRGWLYTVWSCGWVCRKRLSGLKQSKGLMEPTCCELFPGRPPTNCNPRRTTCP